jgi:predicted DNA-binding transcriptional regulator AlpA
MRQQPHAEYRALREELGTQAEVARRLGVSANTVARRERGEVPLTREMELAIRHLSCEKFNMAEPKSGAQNKRRRKARVLITAMPPEGYVDTRTVCHVFATSKSTLWRWISEHRFPAPEKLGPGSTRWNVSVLREHMAKLRNGHATL